MLISFVLLYLALTVAIGIWAARRVKTSKDFVLAGRSLPLYMTVATVFATWLGAETVLSVSATFARDGLGGVVADPFGASFCLVFVALFFARALYRMDLLTIGDFYRRRYNRPVEVATSVAITLSYLGWTSAQLTALGLMFSTLSGGTISLTEGILIGGASVLCYTILGGMWSIALTDLFQSVMIIIGLCAIAYLVSDMAGGPMSVVVAAADAGKLEFWPTGDAKAWFAFVSAFLVLSIGSVPQQDIFQRVTSAKDETTAVRGTLLGGLLYFCFAFVSIYIAYAALVVDPSMSRLLSAEDERQLQRILPELILGRMPVWAQVLFFGALLSAILSTASAALLAPASLFTENVIRPFAPRLGDRQFLLLLRVVLAAFALGALGFALNSRSTMYEMVQDSSGVTMVCCLVPLVAGLYWKRANVQGAVLAVVLGLVVWRGAAWLAPDAMVPPVLAGLLASIGGMVIGTVAVLPARRRPSGRLRRTPQPGKPRIEARSAQQPPSPKT